MSPLTQGLNYRSACDYNLVAFCPGMFTSLWHFVPWHYVRDSSQTDKRTDGRTTCHGNTALCVASRGKNQDTTMHRLHTLLVHIASPNSDQNCFTGSLSRKFSVTQSLEGPGAP